MDDRLGNNLDQGEEKCTGKGPDDRDQGIQGDAQTLGFHQNHPDHHYHYPDPETNRDLFLEEQPPENHRHHDFGAGDDDEECGRACFQRPAEGVVGGDSEQGHRDHSRDGFSARDELPALNPGTGKGKHHGKQKDSADCAHQVHRTQADLIRDGIKPSANDEQRNQQV